MKEILSNVGTLNEHLNKFWAIMMCVCYHYFEQENEAVKRVPDLLSTAYFSDMNSSLSSVEFTPL